MSFKDQDQESSFFYHEEAGLSKKKNIKSENHDDQNSLRPERLSNFVGQEDVKNHLKIFLSSALSRNDTLDHTLFNGPPGLGKTTLAKIIANEMNADIKIIAAPSLTKVADLASILTSLKKYDILFIDEIHRLSKNIEETLYSALEDFKIDIIIGEGISAKIININLEKFTLVGATTRIGAISKPLRDRFGIIFNLGFYNLCELSKMILESAKILEIKIELDASTEIAKRCRGTPRIAIRLIKRIRDFFLFKKFSIIDYANIKEIFKMMDIDDFGLDNEDRRYIKFLATNYKNRPVGIETIADALLIEVENIKDYIEPYLLTIGFLDRTPRGRILTEKAKDYIFNS